jgi:hypothetical protein
MMKLLLHPSSGAGVWTYNSILRRLATTQGIPTAERRARLAATRQSMRQHGVKENSGTYLALLQALSWEDTNAHKHNNSGDNLDGDHDHDHYNDHYHDDRVDRNDGDGAVGGGGGGGGCGDGGGSNSSSSSGGGGSSSSRSRSSSNSSTGTRAAKLAAVGLLREMLDRGVVVYPRHVLNVLQHCLRDGDVRRAVRVFDATARHFASDAGRVPARPARPYLGMAGLRNPQALERVPFVSICDLLASSPLLPTAVKMRCYELALLRGLVKPPWRAGVVVPTTGGGGGGGAPPRYIAAGAAATAFRGGGAGGEGGGGGGARGCASGGGAAGAGAHAMTSTPIMGLDLHGLGVALACLVLDRALLHLRHPHRAVAGEHVHACYSRNGDYPDLPVLTGFRGAKGRGRDAAVAPGDGVLD